MYKVTPMPKVSVLIPTYQRFDLAQRALNSVLAQDYRDFEVLVIDDHSPADIREKLKTLESERVKVILKDKNRGCANSLNLGLKEARGNYIAVLEDDDQWTDKTKLSRQVQFLDQHPDYILVGAAGVHVDAEGRVIHDKELPTDDSGIRDIILIRNIFFHSGVLFRKTKDNYDETLGTEAQDLDFILKLGKKGKIAILPEKMVAYDASYYGKICYKSLQRRNSLIGKTLTVIARYQKDYPHFSKAYWGNLAKKFLNWVLWMSPYKWRDLLY